MSRRRGQSAVVQASRDGCVESESERVSEKKAVSEGELWCAHAWER